MVRLNAFENLYHNFNYIGVRSFILNGAPLRYKIGTPEPAVFALGTATGLRRSTLFDPVMRTSYALTSTRWASARR
jgi:hypothetical protein